MFFDIRIQVPELAIDLLVDELRRCDLLFDRRIQVLVSRSTNMKSKP